MCPTIWPSVSLHLDLALVFLERERVSVFEIRYTARCSWVSVALVSGPKKHAALDLIWNAEFTLWPHRLRSPNGAATNSGVWDPHPLLHSRT